MCVDRGTFISQVVGDLELDPITPLAYQQMHMSENGLSLPVCLNERTRVLAVDCQTIPGDTVRCNCLVSYVKLIGSRYTSVRHRGTQRICSRGTGRSV